MLGEDALVGNHALLLGPQPGRYQFLVLASRKMDQPKEAPTDPEHRARIQVEGEALQ